MKGANPVKTKEELNALKEEVETVSKKLHELTEDELKQVAGGNSGIPSTSCPILESWLKVKNVYTDERKKKYIRGLIHNCYDPKAKECRPCDNCDFFKTYQAIKKS